MHSYKVIIGRVHVASLHIAHAVVSISVNNPNNRRETQVILSHDVVVP